MKMYKSVNCLTVKVLYVFVREKLGLQGRKAAKETKENQ